MNKPPSSPVLLVDDNDDLRWTLKEILESEGFPVLLAANGREALDVLRVSVRPGVILLDLTMPVMNGIEFMEAQRADRTLRDIPVIILSAYSYRSESGMVGAADVLIKPIQPALLLEAIRKYATAGHSTRH